MNFQAFYILSVLVLSSKNLSVILSWSNLLFLLIYENTPNTLTRNRKYIYINIKYEEKVYFYD